MNRVELIGVLIWPVEMRRDAATTRPIGKLMLAVTSGARPLEFIPVTLRGREAADAAKYLGEGSRISVRGHLHSALITDRDQHGRRRTRRVVTVMADRVTYLIVRQPRSGGRP
jgi:single-stranded DNA-binding protein